MSDTHFAMLHLMLVMSVNPTGREQDAVPDELEEAENKGYLLEGLVQSYGIGGIHDDLPTTKIYEDRREYERRNQEAFEQKLKEI